MDNITVSGNANSYTVRGLSGNANYNVSVAAVYMCDEIKTADSITVYGKGIHNSLHIIIYCTYIHMYDECNVYGLVSQNTVLLFKPKNHINFPYTSTKLLKSHYDFYTYVCS